MKKYFVLYWLTGCLLLSSVSPGFSEEPVEEKKKEPEMKISSEDQKVIALMELLQKMEMLKDLDLMTIVEAKK